MKFTTPYRLPIFTSMLVCMFALTAPNLCHAAAGGGASTEAGPIIAPASYKVLAAYIRGHENEALHMAIQTNRFDITQAYLDPDNGLTTEEDINWRDEECDRTALHIAALHKRHNVMELLLNPRSRFHTNSINAVADNKGHTALHIAVLTNSARTARTLLTPGSRFTVKDHVSNLGSQALHVAIINKKESMVRALLMPRATDAMPEQRTTFEAKIASSDSTDEEKEQATEDLKLLLQAMYEGGVDPNGSITQRYQIWRVP